MLRAREIGGTPGPYVLQAAIAVCHAQARTAEDTDWAQIATLYEALARLLPTPIVQLNRAVAVGMAHGPQAGLALVDALIADPTLQDYHLLPGVRGDLLMRLGRHQEARLEFERAASLTRNAAERAFLRRRAEEIAVTGASGVTLGEAVQKFLSRDDLGAATIRSYGQTLRRLCLSLGDQLPLASLTADQVAQVFETAWGKAAAKTWNRHRAAIRSFGAWASLAHLAAGLDRRAETRLPTGTIGTPQLEALWSRPDLPLRERTLWRLLHESAAGVTAVLSLNVEDLDLDNRRARVGGTWVSWVARRHGFSRVWWPAGPGALCSSPIGGPGRPGRRRMPTCARIRAAVVCPTSGLSISSSRPRSLWTRRATATPSGNSNPGPQRRSDRPPPVDDRIRRQDH